MGGWKWKKNTARLVWPAKKAVLVPVQMASVTAIWWMRNAAIATVTAKASVIKLKNWNLKADNLACLTWLSAFKFQFFVQEMQKNGFDVDFKQLQKIYTSSRKNNAEEIAKRKRIAERERNFMHEAMEQYDVDQ